MKKAYNIFVFIFLMMLSYGCASTVQITSVAERNKDGNLLLKWEVSPEQDGNINIYSSQTDNAPESFVPIKTSKIADQVTVISSNNPDIREFYILKTTTAYSGIITNRVIEMNSIKNFRDLGGYFTKTDKQMVWGMLFRSGDLSSATLYDQEKMRRLGIKTIIDFRTENTASKYPILVHPNINIVPIPIVQMDSKALDDMMSDKNLTQTDAIRKIQDSYITIIENYKKEFSKMFEVLLNYDNYPVLISGSLGKDRLGLASFLILSAVGIPQNVIVDDYLLSQESINVQSIVPNVQSKPEYYQEAVTALFSVRPSYINYTIDYLNQKYGSVDNYLEKELKLTPQDKNLLRKYLLYNQ